MYSRLYATSEESDQTARMRIFAVWSDFSARPFDSQGFDMVVMMMS